MPEGKFGPENPEVAVEKFRGAMIKEIEGMHNLSRIKLILERLNIAITDPIKDLSTGKEALQAFARGYNQSQLEGLQNIMREIGEEEKDLE